MATAATFSAVAYPEMRRYGYPQSFSTGVIAAGGTLGAMLPPSTVLAVYGLITQQDIGKLFIAGIVPGLLLSVVFVGFIVLRAKLDPSLAPEPPLEAGPAGAARWTPFFVHVLPLVLIMGVFYFLLIRPQQRKMKQHQEMLKQVSKGDTVITSGGLIGKVVKVVDDNELQVEIGENIKVRVLRSGIADVRAKGEPAKAETK